MYLSIASRHKEGKLSRKGLLVPAWLRRNIESAEQTKTERHAEAAFKALWRCSDAVSEIIREWSACLVCKEVIEIRVSMLGAKGADAIHIACCSDAAHVWGGRVLLARIALGG
eukprot:3864620-Amphidinium_carterae.2